jgi:peptidoglycan hydrolase-like protein with peptidoglycan-binding domain
MTLQIPRKKVALRLLTLFLGIALLSGLSLATAPKASAAVCTHYVYRAGSNGTCVRYIQIMINSLNLGSDIAEDGSFGPITRSKVISLQKTEGIAADGVVGKNTWHRLCSPKVAFVENGNWIRYMQIHKAAGCGQ